MKGLWRIGWLLAISLICLGGCRKADSGAGVYAQVAATAGIGVPFGASPQQVRAKLGEPTQTVERGQIVEDFYVAVRPGYTVPEMPDNEQTQLRLTYFDNKLTRVFNRYHPEESGALSPPVVAQPLPGVKLGLRRSEFERLLGQPSYGELKDGWQFTGEDGSSVVILPHYTEVESIGEKLASSLSIEHFEPGAGLGKGEYFKKKKDRQEALHNL